MKINLETDQGLLGRHGFGRNHLIIRWTSAGWMAVMLVLAVWAYTIRNPDTLNAVQSFNVVLGIGTLAGLTLLCTIYSMDPKQPDRSMELFYVLMLLTYLGVYADNIGWLVDGLPKQRLLNSTVSFITYLIPPILCETVWKYQCTISPARNRPKTVIPLLIRIFVILDIAFTVVATAWGKLYFIDEMGYFRASPLAAATLPCPFAIMLLCLLDIMSRDIPTRKRVVILALCLTPIVSGVSAAFFPEYSYTYIVSYLALMLVYGTMHMERSIEVAEKERQLMEKQTEIMLSQLQPHFLYNALSVASCLCEEDAALAQKVIGKFSQYLRMNMDSLENMEPVPFETELEHTKTYLWIEQMRFGDVLQVVYDIQCSDFSIPPLTLQPLVENAVNHGIRGREEGGTVTIGAKRKDGRIFVTVSDDGIGFDMKKLPEDGKPHVGLENVHNRLTYMGGVLKLSSEVGKGTRAEMILEEDA